MSPLLHDGSFSGFLCAVCELMNLARGGEDLPEVCSVDPGELFSTGDVIQPDEERARLLWKRLGERVGGEILDDLMKAFCSDLAGADGAVARLIVRLWTEGSGARDDLASREALLVEKAARRTTIEVHRFQGFVRFSELADGSWYAPIDSDCQVLLFLADHFVDRFISMDWIIHDTRRNRALLHRSGGPWRYTEDFRLEQKDLPLSAGEEELRKGWQHYFRSIAIESRTNPRCQRNFMPKKFWKNLIETQEPGVESETSIGRNNGSAH